MKLILLFLLLPMFCSAQIVTTIAGGGAVLGDGGPASYALINDPGQMVFDHAGNLYIATGEGERIRKINTSGIISTIAGTGDAGYLGDNGPATDAQLNYPVGLALDTTGNIFIAEGFNNTIRKIDAITGIITTVCGNGIEGYTGDNGPATAAKLYGPGGIGFDKHNNLYIADCNNNVVRKIDASGTITTVAGTGVYGYNGDGIMASTAQLYLPTDVQVDDSDNIYIADQGNFRVRMVNPSGMITTYVGNGVDTFVGDGMPATAAHLIPTFLRFNSTQELYITGNTRIFKVDGIGIFHRVAGIGVNVNAGDGGLATDASFDHPSGLAVDRCDNLFVGTINMYPDSDRIRKITFNVPDTASIIIYGTTSAVVGSTVSLTAVVSGAGTSYSIQWRNNGVVFSTTIVPYVTYVKGVGTDTITAVILPADGCHISSTSSAHIVTVSSVGIENTMPDHAFINIYPNPAEEVFTIGATEPINSIQIADLIGREVLSASPHSQNAQINIGILRAGIYLVKVNGVYIQKLVKK